MTMTISVINQQLTIHLGEKKPRVRISRGNKIYLENLKKESEITRSKWVR